MGKLTGKLFDRVRSITDRFSRSPSPTPSKSPSLGSTRSQSPAPPSLRTPEEFDTILFHHLKTVIQFAQDVLITPEHPEYRPAFGDVCALVRELPAYKEDTYESLSGLRPLLRNISAELSACSTTDRVSPSPSSPTELRLFQLLANVVVHAADVIFYPEFIGDHGSITGDLCTVLKEFPVCEDDVYPSIPRITDALSSIAGTLPLRVTELCDPDPSKPLPPATRMYLNDGTSVPVEQIRSLRYMKHEMGRRDHPYDGVYEPRSGTILSIERGRRKGGHPMQVYFTAPKAEVMVHANVPISSTEKSKVYAMEYPKGNKEVPVTPGYERKKIGYGENEFYKECVGDMDDLYAQPPKRFPFELDARGMLIHESVGVDPQPEPEPEPEVDEVEEEGEKTHVNEETLVDAVAPSHAQIAKGSHRDAPDDQDCAYPTPAASQDPEAASSRASPDSPSNNVGAHASPRHAAKSRQRKNGKGVHARLKELRAMRKSAKKDYKKAKMLKRLAKGMLEDIEAEEKAWMGAMGGGGGDGGLGGGDDGDGDGGRVEERRKAEVREGKKRETPAEDEPSVSTADLPPPNSFPVDPGTSTSSSQHSPAPANGTGSSEAEDLIEYIDPPPSSPPRQYFEASRTYPGQSQQSSAAPRSAPTSKNNGGMASKVEEDGAGSSSQTSPTTPPAPATAYSQPAPIGNAPAGSSQPSSSPAPPQRKLQPIRRTYAYVWDEDGNVVRGGPLPAPEFLFPLRSHPTVDSSTPPGAAAHQPSQPLAGASVSSSPSQQKAKKRSRTAVEEEDNAVNGSDASANASAAGSAAHATENSQRKGKKRARTSTERDTATSSGARDNAVTAPTVSSSQAGGSGRRKRKAKKRSKRVTKQVEDSAASSANPGGLAAPVSSKAEKLQRKGKKHSESNPEQNDNTAPKSKRSKKQTSSEGPASTQRKKRSREEEDKDDEDQSPSRRRKL